MSKRLSLLLSVVAWIHSGATDSKNWIRINSPHFTVITDASEKQGRRIGGQFERMRAVLHEAYPQLESDPDSPIVILAIRDKRQFRALEPTTYLSPGSMKLRGLFMRASEKNYILMRLDAEGGNPYPIVYHEYTHLVLSGFGTMPLWLNEGLAQFYEETEIDHQEVVVGKLIPQCLKLLREEKLLPLPILFSVNEESPYYHEEKKGSIFYAESWVLTRYLTEKDYAERTSRIEQYTMLVSKGMDPIAAAIQVFGDLKKLQKAVQEYIFRPASDSFKTSTIARVNDAQFEVESITSSQEQCAEADFLAHNARLKEARVLVNDLLKREPADPSLQETNAFLEAAEEEQEETELRSAIDRDPSSASACDRLAVFLWTRSKGLEEARGLESKAVSMDPENLEYRINLANILLRMGSLQAGVDMLRTGAAVAKSPQEAQRINQLLADASAYTSAQLQKANGTRHENLPAARKIETASGHDHVFVPRGPHRFLTGVIKDVRCDSPNLDARIVSQKNTVTVHAENYYKIEFTALFTLNGDLDPCKDLENRRARVEYVESVDETELPRLIAVELQR